MSPRSLSLLLALLVLLPVSFGQAPVTADAAPTAEAKADPAIDAKLGSLLDAVDTVAAMGQAADRELTRARRRLKVKTARPVLYILGRRIRRKPAPDPRPELDVVKAACKKVATLAGDCVSAGAKALEAAAKRAASEEGLRKEIAEITHRQLYDQIALEEMMTYLEGGQSSGIFDGMFPTTASHGKAGTDAFLRILLDMDHSNELRTLAGEGVAQLGKKEDKELIEELRRVQEDTMEEPPVRNKVQMVLARLGDRKIFDGQTAELTKAMKEAEANLKKEETKFEEMRQKFMALGADTPEADKKKMEQGLRQQQNAFFNAVFRAGNVANGLANHFQGLRQEHDNTAKWYRKAIGTWMRIANAIWNQPRAKQSMCFAFYNLACICSLQEKEKEAMAALENSFRWGYSNFKWARRDGDLRYLRTKPAFETLVKEVESGAAQKRWAAEAKAQREAQQKKAEEAQKKAEAEKKADGDAASGDGAGNPDGQ